MIESKKTAIHVVNELDSQEIQELLINVREGFFSPHCPL